MLDPVAARVSRRVHESTWHDGAGDGRQQSTAKCSRTCFNIVVRVLCWDDFCYSNAHINKHGAASYVNIVKLTQQHQSIIHLVEMFWKILEKSLLMTS